MASIGIVLILLGVAFAALAVIVWKKRASIVGAVDKAKGQADAVAKQAQDVKDALKK